MENKGLLLILSGPSGAGKGTVYNEVLARRPSIKRSVSVTTRPPRPGEIEGVHYYFKTEEQYREMLAAGEFLETASVYKNHYGTPAKPVFEMLARGEDVMFEIDTLGARAIKKFCPESVAIFLIPPSFEVLEHRLRSRGTESEAVIQRRLSCAKTELGKYKQFDYIVYNDDLDTAVSDVLGIIDAEKRRISRNEERIKAQLAEMPDRK